MTEIEEHIIIDELSIKEEPTYEFDILSETNTEPETIKSEIAADTKYEVTEEDVSNYLIREPVEPAKRQFECLECETKFSTRRTLKRHQAAAHSERSKPDQTAKKRRYKCRACGLNFYNEKTFGFHVKTHAGLMKYSCDGCDAMFNTVTDLSYHRKGTGHAGTAAWEEPDGAGVEKGDKRQTYSCYGCDFRTVLWKQLRLHRARCPDVTDPVTCVICETVFQNQNIYEKHICKGVKIFV